MKRLFNQVWQTGGLAVLLVTATVFASPSEEGPVLVSPRSSGAAPTTAKPCSTFSWAAMPGAASYELSVVPLDPAAGQEGGALLSEVLPAGATSWTPSGEQCLEVGKRYSWTVTAKHGLGRRTSSGAHEFNVRADDVEAALERILDRVVRRLVQDGELTEEEAETLRAWGPNGSEFRPPASAAAGEVLYRPGPVVPVPPEPPMRERLELPPAEGGIVSFGAAFEVHGAGRSRGIFAEGDDYGVYGVASASSIETSGVLGQSLSSTRGIGVEGFASATSGGTFGVIGTSFSTSGTGMFGAASAPTGQTFGVHGVSLSSSGTGVFGKGTFGVIGEGTTAGVEGSGGVIGVTGAGSVCGVFGAATGGAGAFDIYAGGTAANYGPFTGSHEVQLDNRYGALRAGMVVSVTGETRVRLGGDGAVSLSSTFPTVTLSHRAKDPAVFGVLVAETELPDDHWYGAEAVDGDVFGTINSLGEGRVWVTDANGAVRAGDYLTTSDVRGYAQRQGSDVYHSYTVGKAIETVDWSAVTDTVQHDGVTYKKVLLAVVYTSG